MVRHLSVPSESYSYRQVTQAMTSWARTMMESVDSRRTPYSGADLSSATPWTRRSSAPRPCSCPTCGARSTA
eukprot:4196986-Pyramimonas_sp.AAC.1